VGFQAEQVGSNFKHITQTEERFVGQFNEAFLEDGFGGSHKALVAFNIGRIPLGNLLVNEVGVVVIVENSAVVIVDPVERIDRNKFHVVLPRASGEFEDVIEHKGGGDDRWAAIKFEAIQLIGLAPTTGFVPFFKYLNVIASGCKAGGSAQPAKATANDDSFLFHSYVLVEISGLGSMSLRSGNRSQAFLKSLTSVYAGYLLYL
jgi:hypothetical protein